VQGGCEVVVVFVVSALHAFRTAAACEIWWQVMLRDKPASRIKEQLGE